MLILALLVGSVAGQYSGAPGPDGGPGYKNIAEIDNKISSPPELVCQDNGLRISFNTENAFLGNVFVKGRFNDKGCKVSTSPVSFTKAVMFDLDFDQCGISRESSENGPAGEYVSAIVVIMFHSKFLTKSDQAFEFRCFYSQSQKEVSAQIAVSMLSPNVVTDAMRMPTCNYEVLRGGPEGPQVTFASIGDHVFHKWSCSSDVGDMFCMRVHSCVVDDGEGDRDMLINEPGCAVDRYLLGDIEYLDDLTAGRGAYVFKYADKQIVRFQCQIAIFLKTNGQCERPMCGPPNGNGYSNGDPGVIKEPATEVNGKGQKGKNKGKKGGKGKGKGKSNQGEQTTTEETLTDLPTVPIFTVESTEAPASPAPPVTPPDSGTTFDIDSLISGIGEPSTPPPESTEGTTKFDIDSLIGSLGETTPGPASGGATTELDLEALLGGLGDPSPAETTVASATTELDLEALLGGLGDPSPAETTVASATTELDLEALLGDLGNGGGNGKQAEEDSTKGPRKGRWKGKGKKSNGKSGDNTDLSDLGIDLGDFDLPSIPDLPVAQVVRDEPPPVVGGLLPAPGGQYGGTQRFHRLKPPSSISSNFRDPYPRVYSNRADPHYPYYPDRYQTERHKRSEVAELPMSAISYMVVNADPIIVKEKKTGEEVSDICVSPEIFAGAICATLLIFVLAFGLFVVAFWHCRPLKRV